MSIDEQLTQDRHLSLRLAAERLSVPVARHAVMELIAETQVADRQAEAVALAVSEAVSNVVLHAYVDRPAGVIELFAIRSHDQLIVTVADRGRGLNQPAAAPGMGMGLRLIREAADQVLIAEREHGGTTVQCRFVLSGDRVALDAYAA